MHCSPKKIVTLHDRIRAPQHNPPRRDYGGTARLLLIDVRSNPWSRKPGFAGSQLTKVFGERYQQARYLGGRTRIEPATFASLAEIGKGRDNTMLMCAEEAPADCHRHGDIAVPLYSYYEVDCLHVFQDELIRASDLERSLREGGPYPYQDLLCF
jgi:hypothetical protein